ncbi:MAG TPA: diaminopimelate epimerase [Bacillota bacterium]|nr:diaminopimelate epimerase [Bacillota bacterium]
MKGGPDLRVPFTKLHGVGNDYLFIDLVRQPMVLPDLPGLARAMSHRRLGVGADGIILVLPSKAADFAMRTFNADGSEAEMCGNGLRCLARLVFERGHTRLQQFTVQTGAGIMRPELVVEAGQVTRVRVDLGPPRLARREIPLAADAEQDDQPVVRQQLEADGRVWCFTAVSMGNPHCVIAVPDVGEVDLERVGPRIEWHSLFPRRTNVEFVQVLDRSRLRMRIWERGSGVTAGSGTGSAAATVACVLEGRCDRRVQVVMDGGEVEVEWRDDGRIFQTGPAVEVFQGEFPVGGRGTC